jgi:putative spermidine/putrescine transport system permease protein
MAALPPYAGPGTIAWHYGFRIFCGAVLLFLILPILVIIPLSFNAEPYFTYSKEMVTLQPEAYSWRWYMDILTNGMAAPNTNVWSSAWLADSWNNAQWIHATKNSFIIAIFATLISTTLGTLAALGLTRPHMPFGKLIMAILISPMIVPLIISAAGMFFFYSSVNLSQTFPGIILAHAALGTPFVVITVTATLAGFDSNLIRASASLGASPPRTFFKVIVPLISPGVISGGLFAFVTSFDEVVVVLFLTGFEQRTVTRQMWAGVREQISPTILAVATLLVLVSILLLTTLEVLRRRNERMRGMSAQ